MKKLLQVLFSIFFATTISLPAEALATPTEEIDDTVGEQTATKASEPENYYLRFIMGNFGTQFLTEDSTPNAESPMLFVSDSMGKIVKNAHVVATIIAPDGRQMMGIAQPFRSGYLLPTHHLMPGRYRVEAEVVTNGWLLTDEFSFMKS
ncbi:hypothetical protein SAMN05660420_02167 [Desulfuromusa kysingii]|uniref:YtkA-like n=1 Tax=Desulfuromusa kysingii TaxID=37625 RepID=A0A1H4BEF5_9BACT|nr:hypothetical protein [Desulfuromusa kysingii]SEA46553.1 hypothetical protein SAMN05660420_02167 [Desulfuromusa kysingii]